MGTMPPLVASCVSVGVARLGAALFYPALARGPRARLAALLFLAPLVLAGPFLIPLTHSWAPALRWIAAVDAAALVCKLHFLLDHGAKALAIYLTAADARPSWSSDSGRPSVADLAPDWFPRPSLSRYGNQAKTPKPCGLRGLASWR